MWGREGGAALESYLLGSDTVGGEVGNMKGSAGSACMEQVKGGEEVMAGGHARKMLLRIKVRVVVVSQQMGN